MHNIKGRLVGLGTAFVLAGSAVAISVVGGSSADAQVTGQASSSVYCGGGAICYPLARNSVAEGQVVNGSLVGADVKDGSLTGVDVADGTINSNDMSKALYDLLYAVPNNAVTTGKIAPGAIEESDVSAALLAKLKPAYLKHWGTISRNVIGNADAELATTSTEAPSGDGALHIHAASNADAVSWGNEVDFAGKNVKDLGEIGFSVYTTGENNALGNNMPKIVFEIDPNVAAVNSNYSSLVYLPENGAANKWTDFDATGDPGKHWGLTGTAFNGTPCSINGARCTWSEILDYLGDGGDAATVLSAGVGHGRDYAGSWDVDALKFGGKTYDFEPGGVLVK